MNANELADWFDGRILYLWDAEDGQYYDSAIADEIVPMLRQQQALIEQLEKTQDYLYKTHDKDKAEIEVLKAGKIRAYDNGVEDGRKPNTNLVKELTDEEIGDFEYQIIRACGLSTANSDINPIGLRQIIKAILRKAQK